MNRQVQVGNVRIGSEMPLVLISGPCVIENEKTAMETADFLKKLAEKLDIPFIFKSSYDKANRTSINSFRGPGMKEGLRILAKIKEKFGIPILSDVHRFSEIEAAEQVLDVIQIPAFLCRQTDFILEVARTGKPVNIKKGQFLAPWDIFRLLKRFFPPDATGY
jgi:2-dehydro-3-deoxyphosphooctonate aldolase (KDO 8-P synthase)